MTVIGVISLKQILAVMTMKLFDEWERILLSLPLKCLLPELCEGAVVVMDNVPVHKVKKIEPLIQSKGARVLYQSPPES